MKIFLRLKYLLLFSFPLVFFSCSEKDCLMEENINIIHSIYAELDEPQTRAAYEWNDNWSLKNFSAGMKAGLFSQRGNNLDSSGAGGFYNAELSYDTSNSNSNINLFTNDNLQINTYQLASANLMLYYPYSEYISSPGLELRKLDDETLKCIDFILAYEKTYDRGTLTVRFQHQFCVVILVRGKDFDKPQRPDDGDPYEVNFVLDKGYSHVRYASTPYNWQPYPDLVYIEDYKPQGSGQVMTQDDCRKWKAWKGGPYAGNEDAWYAILPTTVNVTGAQPRTKIQYIEIWDNYGNQQKISSFALGAATDRTVYSSNVCPLIVQMDELQPTVYPYPIQRWEDDVDISIKRTKGINEPGQYNEWVRIYNNYVKNDNDNTSELEEQLKSFGDKIDGVWHFNLRASIDNASLNQINVLRDIIDGQSNIMENGFYKNNSISNPNINRPLIGKIEGKGELRNIDLENLNLTNQDAQAIGAIAREIENATFENCSFNATVNSNGPVGILSGSVSNCTIKNCNFSGFLIGTSTSTGNYKNLFGSNPTGTVSVINSDIRSIIFAAKNNN